LEVVVHTFYALSRLRTSPRVRRAARRFGREVSTLFDALLSPNKIIGEVEAMRELQREAARIEATEPAMAAALRRRAARIGRA
jgi:hypothetical protein